MHGYSYIVYFSGGMKVYVPEIAVNIHWLFTAYDIFFWYIYAQLFSCLKYVTRCISNVIILRPIKNVIRFHVHICHLIVSGVAKYM